MQTKTLRRIARGIKGENALPMHVVAQAKRALRIRRREARKGLRHV